LEFKRERILGLANRYGAGNVRVVGFRWLVDDPQVNDLALMVDWKNGATLTDWVAFEDSLARLVGSHVKVVSAKALHWLVRDRVHRRVRPL
jgi:predicted nucleotidyltransferase